MSPLRLERFALAALLVRGCASSRPAPAQTLSSSKLSAHLINGYTAGPPISSPASRACSKSWRWTPASPSGMVEAMRDYKAKAPGGKIVVRVYTPKSYSLRRQRDRQRAGFLEHRPCSRRSTASPASDRALIDYLEGPNEGDTPTLGYPSSPPGAASQWFNQFWTNLTPLMVSAGYKPCIGSIAVGNPGSLSDLDPFVPALRQAKAAGGAWSYHAYTIQYSTDVGVEFWYSLRYRQFYSHFAQQGYSDS